MFVVLSITATVPFERQPPTADVQALQDYDVASHTLGLNQGPGRWDSAICVAAKDLPHLEPIGGRVISPQVRPPCRHAKPRMVTTTLRPGEGRCPRVERIIADSPPRC